MVLKTDISTPLNEVTRWEIIRKSQRESPMRFKKMKLYKAKDFNNVDFESLFTTDTFTWKSRVGDYIVTISFEGAFSNLYTQVGSWSGKNRWKKIDLKLLTKCLSKSLDEDDLYIDCTCPDFCLHEDTLIKSLDGNIYTIKQMYNNFKNGDDIWVYSTDENGDFKPGHVSDVWISGYSNEMIKITLDNDKEILTTPNHLYMLRNGEYMRADELDVGQSLMPLYFRNYKGYENVMLNSKPKSFASVYKTVAETVLQEDIESAKIRSGEDVIAIHHSDFNKSNNTPMNLKPMGLLEHYRYHSNHVTENKEAFEKFVNAGHEYWRTPEGRKIKSDQMRENIKKFWDNMTEEERKEHCKKSLAWQHTEDGHKKLSEARKKHWSNLSDEEFERRRIVFGKNLNGEHGEKASERVKKSWENLTPEQYKEKCARIASNGKNSYLSRIKNQGTEVLNLLLSENLQITEENYEKKRPKNYPHFNTICKHGLLDNFNHKVKSIERIHFSEPIPVYDISVDTYNNFYVDSGVILHNCYRFAFWATQADAKYGIQQNRPPRVRNVRNNQGFCCKHLLATLYGKRWVPAAAKAWLQYIRSNPDVAEELIWG